MRIGKATGCSVLLAASFLGLWDRVLPVASRGNRVKFIYFAGVARGDFLSRLSFSNVQFSAVFPFVGGDLPCFFLRWPERPIMSQHPRLPTDFMERLKVEL